MNTLRKIWNSDSFWIQWGKISGVLTVIWLAVQLTGQLPREPLQATVEIAPFSLPDSLDICVRDLYQLSNGQSATSWAGIVGLQPTRNDLAVAFMDSTQYRWSQLFSTKTLAIYSIVNRGTAELQSVSIDIDCVGCFRAYRSGTRFSSGPFQRQIPLGSLRPDAPLMILVWTDASGGAVVTSRVTHSAGLAELQVATTVFGWSAFFGRFWAPLAAVGVVAVAVIVAWRRGRRRAQATEPRSLTADVMQ